MLNALATPNVQEISQHISIKTRGEELPIVLTNVQDMDTAKSLFGDNDALTVDPCGIRIDKAQEIVDMLDLVRHLGSECLG